MKNLTNYHSHSTFCDGKAPIEDFIRQAVKMGFSSYGVSSHAPVPFANHWSMKKENLNMYLEEMNRLKERYSSQIELYTGLEIDYLHEYHHPASAFFTQLPLDYRIGSVHILYCGNTEVDIDCPPEEFKRNVDTYFDGDLKRMVTAYFDKMIKMIQTGGFDIVGHADKITYNASTCDSDIRERSWYSEKIDELFETVAHSGLIMEINTKAYHRHGIFFPHQKYFHRIKELQIPVTVNSDSHLPDYINDGREEALHTLKQHGINTVQEFVHKKWRETPILI